MSQDVSLSENKPNGQSLTLIYIRHEQVNLRSSGCCRCIVRFTSMAVRITAVRQVEFLQQCPFLHTLVLEGNPVDKLEAYRSRVVFRLQGLMILDRNKVRNIPIFGLVTGAGSARCPSISCEVANIAIHFKASMFKYQCTYSTSPT